MRKILLLGSFLISYTMVAQNLGIGINPTGANPDPSAGLDIDFTDKGVLIPRLTTIQRDAIQNPATGLQIYNTTTDCLQLYTPLSGWNDVVCDCQMTPTSSAFMFTDSLPNNNNVVFTAITAGLNYSWTFQNGTPSTSNLQSDTVTWANPGVYAVTLTTTDSIGCMASTTDSITVIACPPPTALSFTNCSQTGQTGPSQGQCNSAYGGTSLDGLVTVVSGIQEFTVPFTSTYEIEVAGAKGGGNSSGLGVIMKGQFSVNAGETIRVLVGQQGDTYSSYGSGGGGTFVENVTTSTLLIAAGGGGAGGSSASANLTNGSTSTGGKIGYGSVLGGTNGSGGNAGGGSYNGGGGGGYIGDGGDNSYGKGGKSYANGGRGGNGYSSYPDGGFGGGGGNGWYGGGGGGGYSGGGGAGGDGYYGGGGGSYIDANATNVFTSDGQYNGSGTFNGNSITNLNSYNSGHGYVNITLICP